MGTKSIMVSSDLWVQAVTNEAISNGMIWSIVLSSLFGLVSVYVFTGSVVVMILASVTMACINILVIGLYYVLGWTIGAVEGVAITVLVGLSVDFCLHFSEAFVMSPLTTRKDKAEYAPGVG
jgi:protein dispatched 3